MWFEKDLEHFDCVKAFEIREGTYGRVSCREDSKPRISASVSSRSLQLGVVIRVSTGTPVSQASNQLT